MFSWLNNPLALIPLIFFLLDGPAKFFLISKIFLSEFFFCYSLLFLGSKNEWFSLFFFLCFNKDASEGRDGDKIAERDSILGYSLQVVYRFSAS